ncbi:MAG: hypothetical protein L6R28_05335 [Planctomycetes bacterium]|nr:hypothetical protein [Planctomycetota bacterium]
MSETLRNAWPAAAAMLGLLALAAGVAWIITARKAAAENQSPWPQPVELPSASASSNTNASEAPVAAPMCPLPNANSTEEPSAMTTARNDISPTSAPATVPSQPRQVQSATFALG